MKLATLLIIVAAIVLVAIFIGQRACVNSDKVKELQAQVNIDKLEIDKLNADALDAKKVFDQAVAEKDKDILYWQGRSDTAGAQVVGGNAEIKKLKAQLAAIDPSQKDTIIVNLSQQIKILESNLSLCYVQIGAKDKIIADWSAKYDAAIKVNVALDAEVSGLKKMIADQKALSDGLTGELANAQFWGTASKWTALAFSAVAIFELVNK